MSNEPDIKTKVTDFKSCIREGRAIMNLALKEMPSEIFSGTKDARDSDSAIVFAGNLGAQGFQTCMARKAARAKGR
jgi:hypothetical protein